MFVKEANGLPELKMISPLLTNMEVVKCISVRGGTSVYIVKSTKSNQSYYLKHICIPESQKQVDALMFTGAAATVEDAQNYYKQVAADYQAELETLEKLSASPNIGCYRSYQIEPKEDGVGFEIYLLAEYRQTLAEVLAGTPMTQSGAVNLGVDLCSALCSLREAGLIHRNVKPSNVYLSSSGHYLLGDLGIAKIDELKYCSMPETMLSSFSAPELFSLLGTIEPTTDIYSVGMILYRIYNGNTYLILLAVFLFVIIPWITRRRKLAAVRHILNQKKQNKENREMKELAKRFIGEECIIYTITSNDGSVQGVIKEIDDGGMVIEKKTGELEIVNLDFVTRIREYPRKKNGRKKSVVLD